MSVACLPSVRRAIREGRYNFFRTLHYMLQDKTLRHVIVLFGIGGLALAAFAGGDVSLVRSYKDAALIEISDDGRLMLTQRNARKVTDCPDQRPSCSADVLEVYETANGKVLGQLISRGGFNFAVPRFLHDGTVAVVERDWKSNPVRIHWDPAAGRRSEASFGVPKNSQLVCALSDADVLIGIADPLATPRLFRLAVVTAEGIKTLQQPDLPWVHNGAAVWTELARDCPTRLSKDSYLVAADGPTASVYWVSLHPEVKARTCHSFNSERIRSVTLSPDGSVIAVATDAVESASEVGKLHPEHPLWLTVLDSNGCSLLKRFQLEFPEKQKLRSPPLGSYQYYDNSHFGAQFPATMAISPDKSMLAVAYGVYNSPSGYAYFGLYSLTDGHRLATLNGDVLHKWLWSGFLNDEIRAPSAPIHGALRFSADSRTLFGSSQHLRQWDVSRLK
jgi:hypothetical protein